ncbi:tRNA uracil 4-sulfurtransferase ThiI [Pediococcus pentosaceus]|jgi:thiamine biosynthesis protein ThiI|uniref:Probable tRNA sulfurtransferase n=1 Tax=Pediococcus pentosaceus TaxID=1255 RepID=A0ABD7X6L9_PEDPE|nr:tRNA uracil 4-sulfurtransferase ThiI [Pediococcus pentosaceus]AXR43772.1 tRNA 4-thiouridine(8) synthase ThiI [Pediococcus pentosaceus]KAF0518070.1 tRNA 4-thiouridine(8) synthase ThiI [Pediococcus pentosaceus]MBF7112086.1 tRNA 4-thiouridine(8) synthase ThiI [Pediococcus pentosaceus]MBF7117318.1 tRNA 4-thiouridine(8) synthase ThiI [Pediococcus pentosaceus]MBF7119060.1 tRNA 4-thiouridine(8) synthase ThiI [Pediococcus pentosaceus]
MKYTEIMVRYGELSTKGKNRKDFIARLGGNIRKSLKDFEDVEIHPNRDRTHVTLNGTDSDAVISRLKKVFGIQNFSPMLKVEKTMEAVQAGALEMMKEQLKPGMTFKINTRRSDKEFAINTDTMNRELGGFVLDNFPDNDVKMKNPDITLRVEIRSNGIFLTSEVINGAGGLPVGTAGKGMMMLSGGIDSPVAGYLGMKRGVEMEMVHFFSPPYTSEQALAKAKELSGKLAAYSGSVQFIQVPFTEIQETIKEKCPEGYLMTIQRRMMLRLVVALAKQRGGLAIFNGESLGQVASQTMESMLAINDVTTMPIIRPVVSMDKNEIINIAKDIDTYDLSIMPFEDCCTIFAPPSPKTHPDLEKTRYFEKRIDVEGLLERSLAGVKITNIRAEENFMNQNEEVFAELL